MLSVCVGGELSASTDIKRSTHFLHVQLALYWLCTQYDTGTQPDRMDVDWNIISYSCMEVGAQARPI